MRRRSRGDLIDWPWRKADEAAHAQAIFIRGMSLGALIGAAIAGSAIWERRRLRARPKNTKPEPRPEPRTEPRTPDGAE